ncbi:MAG: helix-turn-helix transcriptional regulator [Saprospiraceae bacterium]
MTYFHQNLKRLRKARRYSQVEMGKQFGVAQGSYSGWENGAEPDYKTLIAIAEFFGVGIDEMLTKDLTNEKRTVASIKHPMDLQALNSKVENLVKVVEALAGVAGVNIEEMRKRYHQDPASKPN